MYACSFCPMLHDSVTQVPQCSSYKPHGQWL
jgi:hypothetical protein